MTLWGESIDPSKTKPYELPGDLEPLPPHSGVWDTVFHQSMRDHPWRTVAIGLGLVFSAIGTIIFLHRCRSRRYVALPQVEPAQEEPPMSAMERGAIAPKSKSKALKTYDGTEFDEDSDDPQEYTFLMGSRRDRPPPLNFGHGRVSLDGESSAIMKSANVEEVR
jgi:hypothetical protein